MKLLKYTLPALLLSFGMLATALPAQAAKEKKEKKETVVNSFWNNWFIGIGAGVNSRTEYNPYSDTGVRDGYEFYFGKWFSPYFGGRLGLSGYGYGQTVREPRGVDGRYLTSGPNEHGTYDFFHRTFHVHADFLWNASYSVSGYDRDRIWTLIPYTHFGVMQGFWNGTLKISKREFSIGLGLINNFVLTDWLSILLDIRATTSSGRMNFKEGTFPVYASAFVGLNFNLPSSTWQYYYEEGGKKLLNKDFTKGWFVSLSGGATLTFEGGQSVSGNAVPTNNFDFSFGKWFSPYFGGRLGFQAGMLSEVLDAPRDGYTIGKCKVWDKDVWKEMYLCRDRFGYFHADLLWHLTNSIWGPDKKRWFDLIPYAHTGVISSRTIGNASLGNGLGAGVGLLANFRIDEDFGLFLDARGFFHKSNTLGRTYGTVYATSFNAGVTYNFGGDSWKKAADYIPGEEDHTDKEYRSFAITTNVVDWVLLGTINLGAQYEVGRHWTLEGKIRYNPWTYNSGKENQFQLNQQNFSLGARWWPWYSFAGFWISADAQVSNYRTGGLYRFRTPETGTAYGAAIGLGYSFIINKHFNIDLGVSGWGGYKSYITFSDPNFTQAAGQGKGWFFAPNELSIAAMILF